MVAAADWNPPNMSILSYAQNFEDVMLWRALGHVPKGHYIDIGAQDPVVDSVSKAFHNKGWQGVHIEPATGYTDMLRQQRPGDDVRQVAIGRQSGKLTLYELANSGLSTGDPDMAAAYRSEGKEVRETTVDMITLDDLFNSLDDRPVHWLKIDVEGMEPDVIAGWVNSSVRPWLIVVESTRPGSQQESHQKWESELLAKSYQPVYFDGINRFYLSSEHPELKPAFDAPPNVFDRFVLSGTASQSFCQQVQHETWLAEEKASEFARQAYQANTRLAKLEPERDSLNRQLDLRNKQLDFRNKQLDLLNKQLDLLNEQLDLLNERLVEKETLYQNVHAQLHAVYQSRSWRYTVPIRKLADIAKQVGSPSPSRHPVSTRTWLRQTTNRAVYITVRWVGASPRLKRLGLHLLRACPPLYSQVQSCFHQGAMAGNDESYSAESPLGAFRLSPRQQRIKHQLETAINRHRQQE